MAERLALAITIGDSEGSSSEQRLPTVSDCEQPGRELRPEDYWSRSVTSVTTPSELSE